MNRREFNTSLLGVVVVPWLGPLAKVVPENKPLKITDFFPKKFTINDILRVGFNDVLKVMKDGNPWVDPDLNKITKSGQLKVIPLGASVEWVQDDGTKRIGGVKQITIPLTWSKKDENRCDTENKKIDLVKDLLENWINLHDFVLLGQIGSKRAAVSRQYQYDISETIEYPWESNDGTTCSAYVIKMYTAFAVEPDLINV